MSFHGSSRTSSCMTPPPYYLGPVNPNRLGCDTAIFADCRNCPVACEPAGQAFRLPAGRGVFDKTKPNLSIISTCPRSDGRPDARRRPGSEAKAQLRKAGTLVWGEARIDYAAP